LGGIPGLSAFAQADMAITNAAAGDFIITKKPNKESVERALQEPTAVCALHAKTKVF
jgi:hypothetical protein